MRAVSISRWHRRAGWLTVALLVVVTPALAWACPACFAGKNEENRIAFIITTSFMTFVPVLMLGSLAWWVKKRLTAQPLAVPPVTEKSDLALVGPAAAAQGTTTQE